LASSTASANGGCGTVTGLAGAEVFRAAAALRQQLTWRVAGHRYPISPVSEGFLVIRPGRYERDAALLRAATRCVRPVALVDDESGRVAAAAVAAGCLLLVPPPDAGTQDRPPVTFAIPPGFREHRAAATARRLRHASRWTTPARHAPPQQILAVGVGPWLAADPSGARAALASVPAIVMSDWTNRNTYPLLGLPAQVRTHALEYRFADFEANMVAADRALRALQRDGTTTVGLLIEGNPDTYDILDGLSLVGRSVDVVPGTPIGLFAAGQMSALFRVDPLASRLAYLSGLHSRHGTTPKLFAQELGWYLAAGVTCVLVEMHIGDLDLALRVAAGASRPKTVALISDFYSEAAQLQVLTWPFPVNALDRMNACRGALATVLITDAPVRPEVGAGAILDAVTLSGIGHG
jgi:hypothetical protein